MRAATRPRHLLLVALLGGLVLAGCARDAVDPADETAPPHSGPTVAPSEPFTEVVTLGWRGPEGENEALHAWVADTPDKRALGFMGRTELPDAAGMVFVFPAEHQGGFWMKNTLVPLSIAYLSSDGQVLAVLEMEPCEADPCPVFDPGVSYRYAVEANAGWFAERGIEPGWRVWSGLPEPSEA